MNGITKNSQAVVHLASYEKLVTTEHVDFAACDSAMKPGTLVLSDHRLVLDGGDGSIVELPINAISRLSLSPLRRRLRLDVGDDAVIITGENVTRIHGALSALLTGGGPGAELGAGPEELLDTFASLLMRGPLAHPGELVVTTRRLHFRAHRRLDELAGARPFDVPLQSVHRVSAVGWPERRLTISTRDGEHVFAVEQPAERVQRLVPLLIRPETFGLGHFAFGELPPVGDADPFVAVWRDAVGWDDGETTEVAAPAARWTRDAVADRGWLVVTSRRALFLPLGGPEGGTEPFVAPLSDIGVAATGDPSVITLSYEGDTATLLPFGGARTVRQLLPRVTLSPALRETHQEESPLGHLLGECSSLRLVMGEVELLSRAGERVLDQGNTLAVVLGGTPDTSFEVGAEITVEVGRTEGVYRFVTSVAGLRRTPVDPSSSGAGELLLELAIPDNVHFTNRRGHFRAPSHAQASAWRLVFAEGRGYETLPGDQVVGVADLSDGGCRILANTELTVGDELRLSLELAGSPVLIDARIVRQQGPDSFDGRWMCGVRFFNVNQLTHDRIHREVFRLQREVLVRRANERSEAVQPGPATH